MQSTESIYRYKRQKDLAKTIFKHRVNKAYFSIYADCRRLHPLKITLFFDCKIRCEIILRASVRELAILIIHEFNKS